MRTGTKLAAISAIALIALTGCGKSQQQIAAERAANDAASAAAAAQIERERDAQVKRDAAAMVAAHQAAERATDTEELAQIAERDKADEAAALAVLRERLFDADSAKFRNVQHSARMTCGEVNAKNKMGGYIGFKKFIVVDKLAVVETDDDSSGHGMYNLTVNAYGECGTPPS